MNDKLDHVQITNVPDPKTDEKKTLDIAVRLAKLAKLTLDCLNDPIKQ